MSGKVYLIGAGPGDPELLTLKGYHYLQEADVILYDHLINPILLYWTKGELAYVGKKRGEHSLKQSDIEALLVEKAQSNQVVARLKGGDPAVYGRVAEEMAALDKAEIAYEVVPGITSAFGATTYAGIIATKRHQSEKVSLLTPAAVLHDLEDEPLEQLVDGGTVVLYMGLHQLPRFVQQLDPDLPIAVIEWGTFGRSRKIIATAGTVSDKIAESHFQSPSLIVLGEAVVDVPETSWFEALPHFGESYVYVTDDKRDLEMILTQIRQGADIYPYLVDEAYDERFDEVHPHFLSHYQQVRYKNDRLKERYQQQLLESMEK